MISRVTGKLLAAEENIALLDVAGFCLEISTPRSAYSDLHGRVGQEILVYTVFYLEGNAVVSNFTPRLLGFLNETDRAFFNAFTRVKGVGMRKALRAMSVPAHQIAAAIESGDERALTTLPEIGKKMAAQIVTDLRGQMAAFVIAPLAPSVPTRAFSNAQQIAINILVEWGDRKPDAERLVAAAIEGAPDLSEPEQIVKAAYRFKNK